MSKQKPIKESFTIERADTGHIPADRWSKVLRARSGWLEVDLGELWAFRDLIFLFVKRDFVAIYKQTILGPLWYLLQPLFTTLVFTVVFGKIAKISTQGLPPFLFYMSGIVAWTYFAECLNKTANTFTSNSSIFGKVYFPRLVVPLSVAIINLASFAIQLSLMLAFLVYFYLHGSAVHPNRWLLIVPFLILQIAFLGLGTGIWISALTTRYRDLALVVGFGVQLWMYATPIVYPLSEVPAKWLKYFWLNPMAPIVETFRYAFTGAGQPNSTGLAVSLLITVTILLSGIIIFNRVEKTFMDTI